MSDFIKHECGIALIRLLQPLEYYIQKYGSPFYGLNKLYLLMEKQHNRGQDGAGVAVVKLNTKPGQPYIDRERNISSLPIRDVFSSIFSNISEAQNQKRKKANQIKWMKKHVPFAGELLLGHLRYGTHGKNSIDACHPFIRANNWKSRNLVMAGNFNLTNNDELFKQLTAIGQHPKAKTDTVTVLEKVGHFLDVENQRLFNQYKDYHDNRKISDLIGNELDLRRILSRSARDFDGGYVMAGLIGSGDAFVLRDPAGIRPAFYYHDDEVVVVASERPAIQTAFNVSVDDVKEITPGHALTIHKNGKVDEVYCHKQLPRKSCSFERIYFSRGSDKDIYEERKKLGSLLTSRVLKEIDHDLANTVFSYIPNTAETAFYGMLKGIEDQLEKIKKEQILALNGKLNKDNLDKILALKPRVEKLAIKDVKMRTFITADSSRDELVSHVYDVTYGQVKAGTDTLVLIDDSIVRGTTLKKSIISILDRLSPKKIIVASSAPQIRYPDCYGIDMSKMNDFVAFRAALELIKETGKNDLLVEIYEDCLRQEKLPLKEIRNSVKRLYDPFTAEEISAKISQIVKADHINAEVKIIYQKIEGLHHACPNHLGDWYFTGDYPTPGGNRVVNRAFAYFMEGRIHKRAYN